MIAVIFEVWPADGQTNTYFELAAGLRNDLEMIDGFISVERFQSLTNDKKILSLSFWQDELAIQSWRNLDKHRTAQAKGKTRVFSDYRLRVASVIRDYGKNEREEAPADSKFRHGDTI